MIVQMGCNQSNTLDRILYKTTKNNIYKDIDETKFANILKASLKEESTHLSNPKFIFSFYQEHGFQAVLLKKFLPKNQLTLLSDHLISIDKHGLQPRHFKASQYEQLLLEIKDKNDIKAVDEAYKKVARLEVLTAN